MSNFLYNKKYKKNSLEYLYILFYERFGIINLIFKMESIPSKEVKAGFEISSLGIPFPFSQKNRKKNRQICIPFLLVIEKINNTKKS
jgi:hypothetical protein